MKTYTTYTKCQVGLDIMTISATIVMMLLALSAVGTEIFCISHFLREPLAVPNKEVPVTTHLVTNSNHQSAESSLIFEMCTISKSLNAMGLFALAIGVFVSIRFLHVRLCYLWNEGPSVLRSKPGEEIRTLY